MEEGKSNIDKMIEVLLKKENESIHRTYWSGPGGWINLTDRRGERYRFTNNSTLWEFQSTLKEIHFINDQS